MRGLGPAREGFPAARALAWVYDGAVEAGEADAVDGGETVGVEAEAGDRSCGGGVSAGENGLAVDADRDLLLFDEHFDPVPGVDVDGEGGGSINVLRRGEGFGVKELCGANRGQRSKRT